MKFPYKVYLEQIPIEAFPNIIKIQASCVLGIFILQLSAYGDYGKQHTRGYSLQPDSLFADSFLNYLGPF